MRKPPYLAFFLYFIVWSLPIRILKLSASPHLTLEVRNLKLNMLLHSPEMHIQLVEMLKQGAQRGAFCHLGKGVDILGETLAAVAVLAIRTRNKSVSIINVAR